MKHISIIELEELFSEQIEKIIKMVGPEYGEQKPPKKNVDF